MIERETCEAAEQGAAEIDQTLPRQATSRLERRRREAKQGGKRYCKVGALHRALP